MVNSYTSIYNLVSYSCYYTISANISSGVSAKIQLSVSDSLNLTGGVDIFIAFLGLDLKITRSNYLIDLKLSASWISSTAIEINLKSASPDPIYVYSLYINWLTYNKGYYNRANFASFTLQQAQGSSFTVTNQSYLHEASTMVGLYSLKISNDSFLDFKTQFDSPNSFSISTSNRNCNFGVSYLILLTYYCSYKTPYYYDATNCYDSCPARYYSDLYKLSCLSCAYDCYTCNGTSCLTCDSSQDHRILNRSSNRCVPENGYFESNNIVSSKCLYDCLTCTSNALCTSCDSLIHHRVMNSSNSRCIPIAGYY